jgi:protein SCO1/2
MREFKGFMADSDYLVDTQFILASVDPARDTPPVLKQYLNYFDPSFVGITGDFLTLQAFATNLNAAFAKAPGQGEDYLVDHTANVVLVNPYGHYHGFFRGPLDAARMKLTYQSIRMTFVE